MIFPFRPIGVRTTELSGDTKCAKVFHSLADFCMIAGGTASKSFFTSFSCSRDSSAFFPTFAQIPAQTAAVMGQPNEPIAQPAAAQEVVEHPSFPRMAAAAPAAMVIRVSVPIFLFGARFG
jgi:hypothetical protein